MEYKTKNKGDATVEIIIKNTPEEVDEAYQSAYQKARSSLKLPGFRKGKAPLDLVAKHLGDSVANDAARALIGDTLQEILEELDPPPINMPTFDVEEFDRDKGAVYKGQYDTVPEVKLGKYKKVKVTLDETKGEDADVQKELDRLQKEHALLKTREDEPVVADDQVTLELEIFENETSLYQNESYQLTAGGEDLLQVPELAAEFPGDHSDTNLAGKKTQVKAKVKEVSFNELPALDDDFAKDMGQYETLQGLKDDIRGKIQEHLDTHVRGKAQREIISSIVEDSKIIVPASIVENEYNRRIQQIQQRYGKEMNLETFAAAVGQNVEQLQSEFRTAADKSVREEIVLLEVSKKEKIEVTMEDMEAELKTTLGGQFPEERLKELLDNTEVQDDIKSRLMYKKTVDWLLENAAPKTGKVVTLESLQAEAGAQQPA